MQNAQKLYESGQLGETEAAYREIAKGSSQRAEALYGLGLVSLVKKDSEAAAEWFRKSLEVNPDGQTRSFTSQASLRIAVTRTRRSSSLPRCCT